MKKRNLNVALFIMLLAFIVMINTGCPSSPKTVTHSDSTQGSPPLKKTQKTYTNDSTQGSPPKRN